MASVVNLGTGVPARPQRRAVLDHIIDCKLAEPSAIDRAQLVAARTGQPVEQVLNQLGALNDDDLMSAYAAVSGCEIWDPPLEPSLIDPAELGVTLEFLRRARLLPLSQAYGVLICAACDPLDEEAVSGLVFATGLRVEVAAVRPSDWRKVFDLAYPETGNEDVAADEQRLERELDRVADIGGEGPGARLVASAFEAAISLGASDIHFEPRRHDLRVRLRVDGRLIDHQIASADLSAPAVSRVKVIANLDLGEKRLPQDGRTSFVVGGRQVDVRVATSPTVFGEAAVLRILDRTAVKLDLDTLGLPQQVTGILKRAAKSPHGMFLVTGPTGSGKTTTLYALLQTFAGAAKKVLSVEDPVEYHFEHVVQTQVAPQLGLTFASVLRSFLRQDPDVILVGEIRDPETAAVAVQAAMTGHFVLASVHANDALAVLPRLQDLGVEPYQVAAGLRGAAAQRLVRRLCPTCRKRAEPSESEIVFVRSTGAGEPSHVWRANGCAGCKQTGFRGRIAIGEAFLADEPMLRAIADRRPVDHLAHIAEQSGWRPMAADGVSKAVEGLTTIEDVMAAVDA